MRPKLHSRLGATRRPRVEQNKDRIVRLISEEHGKTIEDATGELQRGIENVEYCAAPEILKGEYSRNVGPNIDGWSDFQPLGVVAGITPFNFPAMVPLWMYPNCCKKQVCPKAC